MKGQEIQAFKNIGDTSWFLKNDCKNKIEQNSEKKTQ